VVLIVGKKGFEGIEGSGEDSSSCAGETGEETSCGDTEVYAGLGSGSGPCKSSSCEDVHRGASCAEHA